jgi:hypothetical protein
MIVRDDGVKYTIARYPPRRVPDDTWKWLTSMDYELSMENIREYDYQTAKSNMSRRMAYVLGFGEEPQDDDTDESAESSSEDGDEDHDLQDTYVPEVSRSTIVEETHVWESQVDPETALAWDPATYIAQYQEPAAASAAYTQSTTTEQILTNDAVAYATVPQNGRSQELQLLTTTVPGVDDQSVRNDHTATKEHPLTNGEALVRFMTETCRNSPLMVRTPTGDMRLNAKLDTGADHNFVSSVQLLTFGMWKELRTCQELAVTVGNGAALEIKGKIMLQYADLKILQDTASMLAFTDAEEFVVADALDHPLILGRDATIRKLNYDLAAFMEEEQRKVWLDWFAQPRAVKPDKLHVMTSKMKKLSVEDRKAKKKADEDAEQKKKQERKNKLKQERAGKASGRRQGA